MARPLKSTAAFISEKLGPLLTATIRLMLGVLLLVVVLTTLRLVFPGSATSLASDLSIALAVATLAAVIDRVLFERRVRTEIRSAMNLSEGVQALGLSGATTRMGEFSSELRRILHEDGDLCVVMKSGDAWIKRNFTTLSERLEADTPGKISILVVDPVSDAGALLALRDQASVDLLCRKQDSLVAMLHELSTHLRSSDQAIYLYVVGEIPTATLVCTSDQIWFSPVAMGVQAQVNRLRPPHLCLTDDEGPTMYKFLRNDVANLLAGGSVKFQCEGPE
jgi:hypothetical protein